MSSTHSLLEEVIIESNDFARLCVRAASEMKAEELVVLDLRELASYCDYFVLCNGTNARQVRAVAQRVLDIMKKQFEFKDKCNWV